MTPMARPALTQEQLESTRECILDAAYALLLEKGPQALSMRAIASRAGMAPMSLYTYFAGQQAIVVALGKRETAKLRAYQSVLEQQAADGDIVAVMQRALALYPQAARVNPAAFRLAWVLPEAMPSMASEAHQRSQGNVEHLARLVQLGIDRGVFEEREPFLAAAAVLGMAIQPLVLFYSGRLADPVLRDRLIEEMQQAALRYLLKEK